MKNGIVKFIDNNKTLFDICRFIVYFYAKVRVR